jgi:hypothetical protein
MKWKREECCCGEMDDMLMLHMLSGEVVTHGRQRLVVG